MSAIQWLVVFGLVAIAAALFYGGKRWIAGRDPEQLRQFFERPVLPLVLIAALIVALLTLAVLPLLQLSQN